MVGIALSARDHLTIEFTMPVAYRRSSLVLGLDGFEKLNRASDRPSNSRRQ